MVDVFRFPKEFFMKFYEENDILKCFLYQTLTNTDSCSLFFIFVCKDSGSLKKLEACDLILKILRNSMTAERLDSSHEIWKTQGFHNPNSRNSSVYKRSNRSITEFF